MNDKKDSQKKPLPATKRKPPASLFLWLLAFLVLASLIVLNSSPYFSAQEEWSANTFLAQLDKGAVVTAEIMPESDKILAISGEFRNVLKPAQTADGKKSGDGGAVRTSPVLLDDNENVDAAVRQVLSDHGIDVGAESASKDAEKKPAVVEKDLTKPSVTQDTAKGGVAKRVKLKYSTRIYATDDIINKLDEKGVEVVYLERDVWWKSLLLNIAIAVPILLVF